MTRRPKPPPYGVVVFDCDSTLAEIEGIEALAQDAAPEVRERIEALTAEAMEGRMPLEQAYGARLAAIRPNREDVRRIGELYVQHALPHAAELMEALRHLGKQLFVVSGGLLDPVRHLAKELGIDASRAMAVDVHFDERGDYAGFDEQSPLARSGGKLDVLGEIALQDMGPMALVGDGATDLEAAPLCARFVAFAGVEARPQVMAAADAVCTRPDLAALLPHLCSPAELDRLRAADRFSSLLAAAEA